VDFPDLFPLQTLGFNVLCVVNLLALLNFLLLLHWQFGEESTCGVYATFRHFLNIVHYSPLELHHHLLFFSLFTQLTVFSLHYLVNESEVVFFQSGFTYVAQCEILLSVGYDCFLELQDVTDLASDINGDVLQ
jgi:hypothetical protein